MELLALLILSYLTGSIPTSIIISRLVKNIDIRESQPLKKIFKSIDIDVVFHLAALADIVPSIEKPYEYYSTNVSGTFNIVNLSKEFKIKSPLKSVSNGTREH